MSGYTLNGNPWGGSFILEASTNGSSWETMVAKSSSDTFLGREGLATGGGNRNLGYNSNAFSNTTLVFINLEVHILNLKIYLILLSILESYAKPLQHLVL
jgi:hypothetical protein